MRAIVALLTAGLLLVAAPSAAALSLADGKLRAAPGEKNRIVLSVESERPPYSLGPPIVSMVVLDRGEDVAAGPGCSAGPKGVRCVFGAPDECDPDIPCRLTVALGDRDDRFRSTAYVRFDLNAGRGDDRVRAEEYRDRLRGGPGADVLRGGWGRDRLFGGAGRDRLFGGGDGDRIFSADGLPDFVHGGRGTDRAQVDNKDLLRSLERPG